MTMLRVLASLIVLASCGAPAAVAPTPTTSPTPPPPDPRQAIRDRIEGTWYLDHWFVHGKDWTTPDIVGTVTFHDGVLSVFIMGPQGEAFLYCGGWYSFDAEVTVMTLGYKRCTKVIPKPELHVDFSDQWGGKIAVLPIGIAPSGELHLVQKVDKLVEGRVFGGFDFTFRPDDTYEYWNSSIADGAKDNVKHFKKAHYGASYPPPGAPLPGYAVYPASPPM